MTRITTQPKTNQSMKALKRLCKAIVDNRFNRLNYKHGKTYYGMWVSTKSDVEDGKFKGYFVTAYIDGEEFTLYYNCQFDLLTVNGMDYREFFKCNHLMAETKCYCSSYETVIVNNEEVHPDCDMFESFSDEQAIETAKELAAMGKDYADIGHVDLALLSVTEIDPDNGDDVRTVWC